MVLGYAQYRLDKNNWSRNGSINTSIILRPERKCFSFLRFLSGVFEYFYCDSPYLNGIDRKGTPLLYTGGWLPKLVYSRGASLRSPCAHYLISLSRVLLAGLYESRERKIFTLLYGSLPPLRELKL